MARSSASRLSAEAIAIAIALWASAAAAEPTPPGGLVNPMVPAIQCLNCHTFPNAAAHAADPPYAPATWQGSLMASSARDPVFWAGVAIADQDVPGGTAACIRCHAPRAFLEGREGAIAMDELLDDDLNGIECELCHRMVDDARLAIPENAQYTIDDVPGPGGEVPKRGPWVYEPGDAPQHGAEEGTYQASSELCGVCHDVTTPRERVDDQGVGMGMPFNEQRTYSEWLGSAFAVAGAGFRSCQDCHMPAIADVAGCMAEAETPHATGGRRHDLSGANRFVLELLKSQYGDSGTGELSDTFLNLAIERGDELLATSAMLEVTDSPAEIDASVGGGLTVRVENLTGHKLPSGYPEGRRMWIEVLAYYDGKFVWSSGAWEPMRGLQRDEQLHTYEAIAEDADDGTQLHLLLNNRWIVDSRLPPRGLVPNVQTDPVGDRYALQDDGTWPHFDVVAYAIPPLDLVDSNGAAADVLELEVRLRYLINTPEYIEFLATENNTNDAGSFVAELFADHGDAQPLTLASAMLEVPLVGLAAETSSGGAPDSSGDADGTTSAATTTGTNAGSETSLGQTSGSESSSDAGQDDTGGCGCTTEDSRRGGASLALFIAVVGARRKRARARATATARGCSP